MSAAEAELPRTIPRLERADAIVLAALVPLAAAIRIVFLVLTELPLYDPWRHLLLVRNLREGLGFTLFEGQPYLWYHPLWYRICALLPERVGMEWLAGLLSLLCVPALYLLLRAAPYSLRWPGALAGGVLMAGSGPLVRFTCHYGPEAFALFLTLAALLLCLRGRGLPSALGAGLLFGLAVASRLNFAFNLLLFLPAVRDRRRGAGLLAGIAAPLLLTWWRNHRILADHAWVFTWDGLATRSADFGPVSTLVPQMHPALQEGLRRLHEIVVPWPEWLRAPDGFAWGLILFMVCGLACVLASRSVHLILTAALTLGYFLLLDRSMSAHFFRLYLVLLPVFFLGAALVGERLRERPRRGAPAVAWLPVALMLLGGLRLLVPPAGLSLELVTPPPGLLEADRYLVNSGFYHPESLMARYPEKRFLGMPLHPEQFDEFTREYPGYRAVLWHDFSVQDSLADHLRDGAGYRVARSDANAHGRRYVVLLPPD